MIRSHYKFRRILAAVLILPLFIILMVEIAIIPFVEKQIMAQKQLVLQQVVEVAYGIIEDSEKQINITHSSIAEAQERVRRSLKEIRYGSNDYFWINDIGRPLPRMIMHPTEPFLEGKLLESPKFNKATSLQYGLNGSVKSLDNLNLFAANNDVVENAGHGYVSYHWSRPELDGGISGELYHKLSYVKLFKPWGWVIGSGIYVDSVHKEAVKLRYPVYSVTLFFTLFLLIISWQLNTAKRKEAEQALRETRELFTLLMYSSPIYIFIKEVTADGSRVLQASENYQQMLGVPGSKMVGKSMEDQFPPSFAAKIAADDLAVLSSGETLQFDEFFDGRSYTTIKFPIIRGGKSLLAGYTIDITDQREAEAEIHRLNAKLEQRVIERTAQLEAANSDLEAFCYSVSHDLRAPLRHIDGYVELLVSRCRADLSDKGLHYLDAISASARQMGVLIDDLLQFSRTGRTEMRREKMDMNQALKEALTTLRANSSERSIEWVIEALPSVLGDHALLRQVWANLLDNAVKYTRTRGVGRIEVSAREEKGEIIFSVADNGVGFDMQYVGKLFGVFQRLHSMEEFEGTGIGLATVQRIINRHGGRIWAEAELNRGATFYFTLPTFKEQNNA